MVRLSLTEESEAELERAMVRLEKERLILLRKETAVKRIDRPTNAKSAKRFGYKQKAGIIVVRVRVPKGGRRKPRPRSGRRPKHLGVVLYTPGLSRRKIAEGRAARDYRNMRVLGSYKMTEDGKYQWYEVVMEDVSRYR